MTCGNCARSVERKLTATSGVSNAKVNLEAGSATVNSDPSKPRPRTDRRHRNSSGTRFRLRQKSAATEERVDLPVTE